MPFNFINLDETTRKYMIEDIKSATIDNDLYFSARFNDEGKKMWPSLLIEAAGEHDEHWLAYQIENLKLMKDFESAKKPLGGYTIKHVPHTASATFAEGQFNRYYMMAVCKCAIDKGCNAVTIYRAKLSDNPRSESEKLIGQELNPETLRAELKSIKTCFKCAVNQPNSGLSVKI